MRRDRNRKACRSKELESSDCEPRDYGNRRTSGTGNEADIEDNLVLRACTPTPIELYLKLKQKPADSLPSTPCKIAMDRRECLQRIATQPPPPTEDRLIYRPVSALEAMSNTIEKPKGSVPPTSLPHWHSLPLTNRIPYIQAPGGLLYYSPGKLSVQLARQTKDFDLADPYNRERVVPSGYTALNDPHAKDFINKPQTKQLLYKQGLINKNDEVLYSHSEFNDYRDYLRALHNDEVHEILHEADELWKKDREQLRRINTFESQSAGKAAKLRRKIERCRRNRENERQYMLSRYLFKEEQTALKLARSAKEKREMFQEKVAKNMEKRRVQMANIQELRRAQKAAIIMTFERSLIKTIQSMERRREQFICDRQDKDRYLLERMDRRINQSREKLNKDRSLGIAIRERLQELALKRQREAEIHRANMPLAIQKRKQRACYELKLAQKYFGIWRANVAKRTKDAENPSHTSLWTSVLTGTLTKTVKYLQEQAGVQEKLDTFILQILKMKEAIRSELELEEEEEMDDEIDLEETSSKEKARKTDPRSLEPGDSQSTPGGGVSV